MSEKCCICACHHNPNFHHDDSECCDRKNQSFSGKIGDMNQSESETVLKIRFVLLEKAIVMQVLEQDNGSLEIESQRIFEASNGFTVRLSQNTTALSFSGLAICPNGIDVYYLENNFSYIKQALTEFAENNCFYGVEKPKKRVEKENGKYFLYADYGFPLELRPTDLDAISEIAGSPLPIYEDKLMFSHEWTQIFPREIKREDFWFDIADFGQSSLEAMFKTSRVAASQVNQILAESAKDLQIWEFTVRRNK